MAATLAPRALTGPTETSDLSTLTRKRLIMKYRVLRTTLRSSGIALVISVAAALFSTAPASAQFGRNKVQYEDFDFRVMTLPHWDLYFYPEEEESIQDVARMSERWYERFARTFQHEFETSKPLIVYADHPDFQQTNTLQGAISEGTGGVTESLKNRVIMPQTGSYRDTDHVLGHEIVHAFQYNIAQSRRGGGIMGLGRLPLWLIEGMAEYFSLGRDNPLTGMWLRDALRQEEFPTIKDLTKGGKFFPYRFGQALWAYVGGTYGDDAVVQLFRRSLQVGFSSAIEQVLGISQDSLSVDWKNSVEKAYRSLMKDRIAPDSTGTLVLSPETGAGSQNIGPSLSPDGLYIAYMSEQDLFSVDLFLADAKTGKTIRKLSNTTSSTHFDALRFVEASGTWSPDGKYFAYAVLAEGDNNIVIVESANGRLWRTVKPLRDGAVNNPAWSPDGRSIAFTGTVGGISDLYLYDIDSGDVRQLTNDRNADFNPDWSPDGATIAFSSDRGPETDFDKLAYSEFRLSFLDVESGQVHTPEILGNVRHSNPQYAPDGNVYFLADPDGFSDIYQYQYQEMTVRRITRTATGVSGHTNMAPALSVADKTGELAFTVFSNFEFHIVTLPATPTGILAAAPTPEEEAARRLPPANPDRFSRVGEYLADTETGLEPAGFFSTSDAQRYQPSLALDYLGQPSLGVGSDRFGNTVGGGAAASFSDMLGNKILGASLQAQGSIKDIGGSVFYADLSDRWNKGIGVGHIPYMISFVEQGVDENGPYLGQILDRLYVSTASAQIAYPFSTTRRFEASGGVTRYASNQQIHKFYIDQFGRCCLGSQEEDRPNRFDPLNLVNASVALVYDNSYFGFVSPVRGGRSRYDITATTGTLNFLAVTADWRRYWGLHRNLTFAARGLHYGRYGDLTGKDNLQQVLQPTFLGYEWFIRGYDYGSFTTDECGASQVGGGGGVCPVRNRLFGHKVAVMSAEFRMPLVGVEEYGLLTFPFMPTELVAFADGGLAWDSHILNTDGTLEMSDDPVFKFSRSSNERIPVFSAGIGARFNVLGFMVLEAYYAYPFQRPEKGGHWGFQMAPGW
jgi:Tol biopolymer transport system component